MDKNSKILVAGIGGVGGIISGPLIKKYGDAVTLMARGERKKHLINDGLTIDGDHIGHFSVHPSKVVEDPGELPVQDLILVCTKNSGLEPILKQLEPVIGPDTAVMTVMNGVSAGERTRKALKQGHAIESVIYTVSKTMEDFSVRQIGNYTRIFVGSTDRDPKVQQICQDIVDFIGGADIECHYEEDVASSCWTKYILNCAFNVVTARWGIIIGKIQEDKKLTEDYQTLMEEARDVALAMGVNLDSNIVDMHMERLRNYQPQSTSSLSRDFEAGKAGEMEVFSGELIRMAGEVNVPVPMTEDYYKGLCERAKSFK